MTISGKNEVDLSKHKNIKLVFIAVHKSKENIQYHCEVALFAKESITLNNV